MMSLEYILIMDMLIDNNNALGNFIDMYTITIMLIIVGLFIYYSSSTPNKFTKELDSEYTPYSYSTGGEDGNNKSGIFKYIKYSAAVCLIIVLSFCVCISVTDGQYKDLSLADKRKICSLEAENNSLRQSNSSLYDNLEDERSQNKVLMHESRILIYKAKELRSTYEELVKQKDLKPYKPDIYTIANKGSTFKNNIDNKKPDAK